MVKCKYVMNFEDNTTRVYPSRIIALLIRQIVIDPYSYTKYLRELFESVRGGRPYIAHVIEGSNFMYD